MYIFPSHLVILFIYTHMTWLYAGSDKNLSFLTIILFIIITFLKLTAENSDEKSFDINSLKNTRKRSTSIFKAFKKKMI